MKRKLETIFGVLRSTMLATVIACLIFGPTSAMAATNTATWDIGGTSQSNATITINAFASGSVTLTKLAFLTDGTQLADGATVPADTEVRFILYVENTNGYQMNNISMSDVLAPADFTMTSANFSYIELAGTGLAASTIYNEVTGAGVGTPSTATFNEGDDIASFDVTLPDTISIGTSGGVGDTQLNVSATSTWAIIFNAQVHQ